MIPADRVEEVLQLCLVDDGGTVIEGVVHSYRLDVAAVEKHRIEVNGWIDQLEDEFMADKGGGWSFLNLCNCKEGLWTGSQMRMEQLVVLASALGQAKYLLPRELWYALPGGVPYVTFSRAKESS